MAEALTWTLIVALIILISATIIVGIVAAVMWAIPRLERMQKGEKWTDQAGNAPCCPPGLGCNDPDGSYRVCRRKKARDEANYEEHQALEAAWQEYSIIPEKKRFKKDKALALEKYARIRDAITARALLDHYETAGRVAKDHMIGSGSENGGEPDPESPSAKVPGYKEAFEDINMFPHAAPVDPFVDQHTRKLKWR